MHENEKRFHVIKGQKEGIQMTAVIDKNYKDIPNQHMFTWFLRISLQLDQQGKQLSNQEIDSFVNKTEGELSQETDIIYIGELTWNGYKEHFYYVASGNHANDVLDKLVSTRPSGIGFQYEIAKDNEWGKVAEMFGW